MEAVNEADQEAELKGKLMSELKKDSCEIDWALVIRILEQNENAVRWKDCTNRYTVLHKACFRGAPIEVVQHIYGLWPGAVDVPDYHYYLPIHDAARFQSPDVIELLTRGEEGKASLNERNIHGNLPLHGALYYDNRPIEAIQLLVERGGRETVATADIYGCLPLHLACRSGQSLDVIKLLVKTYPEATQARYSTGMSPLDLARQALRPKIEAIEWLTELDQVEEAYKRIRNLDGTDLNDLAKYLTSEPSEKKKEQTTTKKRRTDTETAAKKRRASP